MPKYTKESYDIHKQCNKIKSTNRKLKERSTTLKATILNLTDENDALKSKINELEQKLYKIQCDNNELKSTIKNNSINTSKSSKWEKNYQLAKYVFELIVYSILAYYIFFDNPGYGFLYSLLLCLLFIEINIIIYKKMDLSDKSLTNFFSDLAIDFSQTFCPLCIVGIVLYIQEVKRILDYIPSTFQTAIVYFLLIIVLLIMPLLLILLSLILTRLFCYICDIIVQIRKLIAPNAK